MTFFFLFCSQASSVDFLDPRVSRLSIQASSEVFLSGSAKCWIEGGTMAGLLALAGADPAVSGSTMYNHELG